MFFYGNYKNFCDGFYCFIFSRVTILILCCTLLTILSWSLTANQISISVKKQSQLDIFPKSHSPTPDVVATSETTQLPQPAPLLHLMKVNGIREELVDGDPSMSTVWVSALLCLSGPFPLRCLPLTTYLPTGSWGSEEWEKKSKRVEGGRALCKQVNRLIHFSTLTFIRNRHRAHGCTVE